MPVLSGIPASPGVAIGPAHVFARASLDIPGDVPKSGNNLATELARYHAAVAKSCAQVTAMRAAAGKTMKPEEAEIFSAHLLMLEDPALEEAVSLLIREKGFSAESAAAESVRGIVEQFEALEDDYFRARASDVRDIGRRIIENLFNADSGAGASPGASAGQTAPFVLVAEELIQSGDCHLAWVVRGSR